MKWYNYKATTLNTPLHGNAIVESGTLESFINAYQANSSLYHCFYDLEKRESFVDYQGLMYPVFSTVHFDFDSDEEGSEGKEAWEDTKKFCLRLKESQCDFHLYFSGNKGFHVAVHARSLGITDPEEKLTLESKIKTLCMNLKSEYPTLDTRIWNANRKFRAYRSQHEKTHLYKIRLTGVGLRPSSLTIEEIRNLALQQPVHKYAHPQAPSSPVPWLHSLIKSTPPPPKGAKSSVRELPQGQTIEDDSLRFKNFEHKKCVFKMLNGQVLPQFNRHDIELVLAVEMRLQGKTLADAETTMRLWASRVFSTEPDRIEDCIRQLRDMYKKDLETNKLYQFGCYGDVKSAYCSAKCKIYDNLDRKKRAEALDCTKAQRVENEVRRNPLVEKSEGQLADEIISKMPELCKSNGQYFQWVGTHWNRIDGPQFEDSLVKVAMNMYGNQANIKKNKALAEHVIAKIPIAPETNHFFSSCPNKFNFTDCTAEMIQESGVLKMITYPHNSNDYLSYCAPFPLKAEHNLPKGNEFKKYMETRLQDVGEEGVRIIKQMLGAALIPYVPRIFFIEGVTNAGKSTLAKLIMRLLGQENISEVLPIIRGGGADRFNWEPAIGKLANIVLELPKGTELDVNTLKMVRDKSPISIDRKKEKHVKATLPFLHIYCCNQMPQSFEGNTGALNNRVSMLFFRPGYLNGSSGIVEFADAIWADDAGSVLEAAREGLADLIESGFHYFNGNASQKATSDWQKMTDTIQLYFDDVNSGEWAGPSWEGIEWEKGSVLWSDFKDWCSESGRRPMGKHNLYKELETRFGVPRKRNAKGGERFNIAKLLKLGEANPTVSKSDQNPTFVSALDY